MVFVASSGPPLVVRHNDLLVEYRVGVPDGWDRGIPNPGVGASGWVVVHRSPRGAPSAVFVGSVPARPGNFLVLGKDNPLDIFEAGPLRLSVLSFNAAARTVRLQFWRTASLVRSGNFSMTRCISASHSTTFPSKSPVATFAPSWLNATAFTDVFP